MMEIVREARENMASMPIAIVGMACRLPKATNVDDFWQMILEGVDAVTEVPADRWSVDHFFHPDPDAPGRMYTKRAATIDGMERFDAGFFGISPREAEHMDPQQRMLLEAVWEALEHAGYAPDSLSGQPVGCYVGVSGNEYAHRMLENVDQLEYILTGTAYSMVANRISYVFNFCGPSFSVDTACSSSLVALHLACQSLRLGEAMLALAAGTNVVASPWISIAASKAALLSRDGRCKTFDARADGYGRGEGVGVVVLKLLDRALADGDRICAVILGSAVNQDGRSNGLTAPNPAAQEAVLRASYRNAGISPADVQYVEAHGTGTRLGDAIEMKALGTVLAEGRRENDRCLVGSVKPNIGHLEAAAGIVGIIKAALALEHAIVPPQIHYIEPNPLINLGKLPLDIPRAVTPWPATCRRVAGVSGFGLGGTNAHVVLGQAPEVTVERAPSERGVHMLGLSAKSSTALRALAIKYVNFFRQTPEDAAGVADICHTAGTGRAHFGHRVAATGAMPSDFVEILGAFANSDAVPATAGRRGKRAFAPKLGWVFPGESCQYPMMAHDLYETQPVFRQTIERCDDVFRDSVGRSLVELLYSSRSSRRRLTTCDAQPAIFAVEVALTEMLRSWGVVPTAVIGHGVGEFAACYAAGVFGMADGLRLVAERARLMQKLRRGAMVGVAGDRATVDRHIAAYDGRVAIAAINGRNNVVISGAADAIGAVVGSLTGEGVHCHALSVSRALYSPLMRPILPDLREALKKVRFCPPSALLVSGLTGRQIGVDIESPEHWCRHALEPVRFEDGVAALRQQQLAVYLEVGPQPVLSSFVRQSLDPGVPVLATLCEDGQNWRSLLNAAAVLYERGASLDWKGIDAGFPRRRVRLPSYPFRREKYSILGRPASGRSAIGGSVHFARERAEEPLAAAVVSPRNSDGARDADPVLVQHLQTVVKGILRLDDNEIDLEQSLTELGLDSLMSVELQRIIKRQFEIDIMASRFLEGVSLSDVVREIGAKTARVERSSAGGTNDG
jgi:acyl transferase domain-containing protein